MRALQKLSVACISSALVVVVILCDSTPSALAFATTAAILLGLGTLGGEIRP